LGYGYKDGHISKAQFNGLTGITYDRQTKTFYVVDRGNFIIRSIDADMYVSSFAASFNLKKGFEDGYPMDAKIDITWGLAFDSFIRKLIIFDTANHALRMADAITGEITTYIGHGQGTKDGGINGTADGPVSDAYLNVPFGGCVDKFGNCIQN
jgi:hypothetical protein